MLPFGGKGKGNVGLGLL